MRPVARPLAITLKVILGVGCVLGLWGLRPLNHHNLTEIEALLVHPLRDIQKGGDHQVRSLFGDNERIKFAAVGSIRGSALPVSLFSKSFAGVTVPKVAESAKLLNLSGFHVVLTGGVDDVSRDAHGGENAGQGRRERQ